VDAAGQSYGISLPDRQLAAVPVSSPEGEQYLGAMCAAANFAWANRQSIAHFARQSFEHIFGRSWEELGMRQVYDLSHNMAKIESHDVDGKPTRLCVHRKGATRSFPPGHPDIPGRYQEIGQPVLIPGDMGRASYVAVGVPEAMGVSFGSSCHGAGRVQSRTKAKKMLEGRDIGAELAERGIAARAQGRASLAEEASEAYKDVSDVVRVSENAGLCKAVVRLRPLGVIKG
jgi:tRNA-splicing ligase RtcB